MKTHQQKVKGIKDRARNFGALACMLALWYFLGLRTSFLWMAPGIVVYLVCPYLIVAGRIHSGKIDEKKWEEEGRLLVEAHLGACMTTWPLLILWGFCWFMVNGVDGVKGVCEHLPKTLAIQPESFD